MNCDLDPNAERIAEISQSEYIWSLFVEGELSSYEATSQQVLQQARGVLENNLTFLSPDHRDRVRVEGALARLRIACQS